MKMMQGPVSIDVFSGQRITFEIDQVGGSRHDFIRKYTHLPIVECRVATQQRRARGSGNQTSLQGPLRRHKVFPMYGRRATDVADHEERRVSADIEARRKANDGFVATTPRRRKGDERRIFNWNIYMMSPDPRIRALERRKP